ncbi:phage-related baseplate assembly protein [Pseudorhizobium tarimense]|uniref:Phage-related baseplate assembly protein n=1 Tax=Pseudorhizobium tarimense TaxID=1079109 RepID=A0ABV2H1Z7_9HYPH|nr:baseplate J/gp47 family protein [Pseudorhizobium tarimense]MCJ8517826.1 baseplate J/gp47 family protein [Pseudorhizobium tarimense]
MTTDPFDLSLLPAPGVIEDLKYDSILSRQRSKFMEVWEAVRAANPGALLPAYDVELLETDPAMIGNEAETYRETVLRARINDAVRANLLAFATGSDLDHLGAFYDQFRMAGEGDDRFASRVILAIQGRSTGGTEPRYRLVALSADTSVADVIVYTKGRSPLIHVAVYSTAPDGVASPALLAKVNAALQAPGVRMVNDTIVVASAVRKVVDIEADYWLLPEASADTATVAEDNLRTSWLAVRSLGRDLTAAWWTSKLMVSGMHKVAPISPLSDVVANPSEAISIGTVTLHNRGRAY